MTQELRCLVCNRYLVMTDSGYFCCPCGHGGLVLDTLDVDPAPELPGLFITSEECHD